MAPKDRKSLILAADGTVRDLSSVVPDITGDVLANQMDGYAPLIQTACLLLMLSVMALALGDIGKFMCIGLNYSDHAAETGAKIPENPILFMKATSAVIGPNDMVMLPRGSTHTDWEVELGLVIGKTCKYVTAEEALDYVAGYFVANDVSERHFQLKLSGSWTRCDITFGQSAHGLSQQMK